MESGVWVLVGFSSENQGTYMSLPLHSGGLRDFEEVLACAANGMQRKAAGGSTIEIRRRGRQRSGLAAHL